MVAVGREREDLFVQQLTCQPLMCQQLELEELVLKPEGLDFMCQLP